MSHTDKTKITVGDGDEITQTRPTKLRRLTEHIGNTIIVTSTDSEEQSSGSSVINVGDEQEYDLTYDIPGAGTSPTIRSAHRDAIRLFLMTLLDDISQQVPLYVSDDNTSFASHGLQCKRVFLLPCNRQMKHLYRSYCHMLPNYAKGITDIDFANVVSSVCPGLTFTKQRSKHCDLCEKFATYLRADDRLNASTISPLLWEHLQAVRDGGKEYANLQAKMGSAKVIVNQHLQQGFLSLSSIRTYKLPQFNPREPNFSPDGRSLYEYGVTTVVNEWTTHLPTVVHYISGEQVIHNMSLYNSIIDHYLSAENDGLRDARTLNIMMDICIGRECISAIVTYFANRVDRGCHEKVVLHFAPLGHIETRAIEEANKVTAQLEKASRVTALPDVTRAVRQANAQATVYQFPTNILMRWVPYLEHYERPIPCIGYGLGVQLTEEYEHGERTISMLFVPQPRPSVHGFGSVKYNVTVDNYDAPKKLSLMRPIRPLPKQRRAQLCNEIYNGLKTLPLQLHVASSLWWDHVIGTDLSDEDSF